MNTVFIIETPRGIFGAYTSLEAAQDYLPVAASKLGFDTVFFFNAVSAALRNEQEATTATIRELHLQA